jgi:hypothetical protein
VAEGEVKRKQSVEMKNELRLAKEWLLKWKRLPKLINSFYEIKVHPSDSRNYPPYGWRNLYATFIYDLSYNMLGINLWNQQWILLTIFEEKHTWGTDNTRQAYCLAGSWWELKNILRLPCTRSDLDSAVETVQKMHLQLERSFEHGVLLYSTLQYSVKFFTTLCIVASRRSDKTICVSCFIVKFQIEVILKFSLYFLIYGMSLSNFETVMIPYLFWIEPMLIGHVYTQNHLINTPRNLADSS